MKDILNQEFIEKHGRPDVIITDPPRAGMHADVINTILFAADGRTACGHVPTDTSCGECRAA